MYNDQQKALDTLNSLKQLLSNYTTFAIETDNQKLFTTLLALQNELYQAQHELYVLMKNKQWYKVEMVEPSKIQQTAQTLQQLSTEFK